MCVCIHVTNSLFALSKPKRYRLYYTVPRIQPKSREPSSVSHNDIFQKTIDQLKKKKEKKKTKPNF